MPTYCFTNNTTPSEGTKVSESWVLRAIDSNDDTNHGSPLRVRAGPTPTYKPVCKPPGILTTLTAGMTVTAAKLRLYNEQGNNLTFQAYRVLRNWTDSGVRWSEWSAGNAWATAGATDATDVSTTLSGSYVATGGVAQYLTLEGAQLIADIQAMIDGSISNYGWIVLATTDSGSNNITQNAGTDGHRPELIVTVTAGGSPTSPPPRPQGTRIAPLMFY